MAEQQMINGRRPGSISGKPPRSYAKGRVCACGTKLSQYTQGNECEPCEKEPGRAARLEREAEEARMRLRIWRSKEFPDGCSECPPEDKLKRRHTGKGLCSLHYQRRKRAGTLDEVPAPKDNDMPTPAADTKHEAELERAAKRTAEILDTPDPRPEPGFYAPSDDGAAAYHRDLKAWQERNPDAEDAPEEWQTRLDMAEAASDNPCLEGCVAAQPCKCGPGAMCSECPDESTPNDERAREVEKMLADAEPTPNPDDFMTRAAYDRECDAWALRNPERSVPCWPDWRDDIHPVECGTLARDDSGTAIELDPAYDSFTVDFIIREARTLESVLIALGGVDDGAKHRIIVHAMSKFELQGGVQPVGVVTISEAGGAH